MKVEVEYEKIEKAVMKLIDDGENVYKKDKGSLGESYIIGDFKFDPINSYQFRLKAIECESTKSLWEIIEKLKCIVRDQEVRKEEVARSAKTAYVDSYISNLIKE